MDKPIIVEKFDETSDNNYWQVVNPNTKEILWTEKISKKKKKNKNEDKEIDITYPDKFFDFSEGVDIDKYEINKWINDILFNFRKKMNKKKKTLIHFISTGNCFVVANGYRLKNSKKYTITIRVCKNYQETEFIMK